MTNRNKCKQWFYTYPQTTEGKHEFRDKLQQIHSLKYYKVAEETHKDGGKHLHAVVLINTPISKSNIIKKLKIIYPDDYKRIDVQSVRSIKHSLAYISKEDSNPLESSEAYSDPRNPLRAFHTRIARQWGFTSVEQFRTYMNKEYAHRQAQETKFLDMVCRVEQVIRKYPKQLSDDSDIRHLLFYKNKMMDQYNYDNTISKDDMTFFTKLFNSTVELL